MLGKFRLIDPSRLALWIGLLLSVGIAAGEAHTLDRSARDTLTAVEMNHGDTLRFRLKTGELRTFVLEQTRAWIVEKVAGGIVYAFECKLLADSQPLVLRRYVCSQQTFYEPWVVNGVRIWFSSSAAIFRLAPIRYPEDHYKLDAVDAIFAMQDATLPICPQPMRPWFPLDRHFLDVAKCYNGDDPWLGPYLGQACHVGLDINMPKGTPLYAPIDFDDHWIFSADHRWRGVRRWENGEIWGLQSHHVDRLLVPEGSQLKAGAHYGEAAGQGVGSHPHSHFEFRIGRDALNRGHLAGMELDPWILFWQIFETDKQAQGHLRAKIGPLAPTTTGQPVEFSSAMSRAGQGARPLRHVWSFGDGGCSDQPAPQHTFVRPGVYPVTLVVDDGQQRATHTQHITVNGEPLTKPALVLHAPDEVTFRPRPMYAADVYGWPVTHVPHTLRFIVATGADKSPAKEVVLDNLGSGELPLPSPPEVTYLGAARAWLRIDLVGTGNSQRISASVNAGRWAPGNYEAVVAITCPGVVNARQVFRIELQVRPAHRVQEVVIDDRDAGMYVTPCAWVGHQFLRAQRKGHQQRYLTNGGLADEQAIARFTPDLAAGSYEVRFHGSSPLVESSFPVRIRHAKGMSTVRFTPGSSKNNSLGVFHFAEGNDGYAEVVASDSTGLVVVDAVVFSPK